MFKNDHANFEVIYSFFLFSYYIMVKLFLFTEQTFLFLALNNINITNIIISNNNNNTYIINYFKIICSILNTYV